MSMSWRSGLAFVGSLAGPVLGALDSLATRLEAQAAAAFRPDGSGGVVPVARHGTPLVRRAFFTAVELLRLVAEGKVSLDDGPSRPSAMPDGRPFPLLRRSP